MFVKVTSASNKPQSQVVVHFFIIKNVLHSTVYFFLCEKDKAYPDWNCRKGLSEPCKHLAQKLFIVFILETIASIFNFTIILSFKDPLFLYKHT
jgi:hypothetical protein